MNCLLYLRLSFTSRMRGFLRDLISIYKHPHVGERSDTLARASTALPRDTSATCSALVRSFIYITYDLSVVFKTELQET